MSAAYVSVELRRFVVSRAEELCEYCLIHEDDTFFGCQIDHIISEKHGGTTHADNLSYACLFCNLHKSSDIATFIPKTQMLVRFFNPRVDRWCDHFLVDIDGITILPLTDIGEATARILGFNSEERLRERQALKSVGRYPTAAARKPMG
jgi:hypothetical protein